MGVVARIKGIPAPAEIRFKPSAEIHRIRRGRHADVAEIAGAIPGWDIHAAAERDRYMREIPTDTHSFVIRLVGGARSARLRIIEAKMVMGEVANGLHPRPAGRAMTEELPGEIHHQINLAIAARHEKSQGLIGQIVNFML